MKIDEGDVIAITHFVRVKHLNHKYKLGVEDLDRNMNFVIEGRELVESCMSSSNYSTSEKVTKTRLAEILVSSHNKPFTVHFNKDDGSERILVGRLVKPEPLMGRSYVNDLEKNDGQMRLVNHRGLNWIIVDNIKYYR